MQFGDFFFDGDKRKIYEAPAGFSYVLDGDGYRIYTPDDEPSAPQSLIFTTYVLWSRYVDYMDAIEWARKALSISGGAWRYTDQYDEDKYSLIDLRLINDWAFVPSNYPHFTYIKGNLFPNEATNIDFDTSRISVQGVSPRIMFSDAGERSAEDAETAAQNTAAVRKAAYEGTVTVKESSSNTGTEYPVGTPGEPVNNMADAHTIADDNALHRFTFLESMPIETIDFSDGHIFEGVSPYVLLTIAPSANLQNCEFNNISIQGEVDGMNVAMNCFILNVTEASGVFHQCAFGGSAVLNGDMDMFDCYSRIEGGGYPTFNSGSHNIVARNHKGSFGLRGAAAGHLSSVGVYGGRFIAEDTCIGGEVHVRGEPFEIVDDSAVGCNVINETASEKANEMWELAGLDTANPMTVTPTTRVAGDISLVISGDGETTSTVTRQ